MLAMNAITSESTRLPTAADIEQRIRDERNRRLGEQNLEVDLNKQRLAPLEQGDDVALDRIEEQIGQCQDRQSRIQERLEILEKRLASALANDQGAHLDTVAARAQRAREAGERAIKVDYPKAARTLAAVLHRIAAADGLIARANAELERGGREQVPDSNSIRCTPIQRITSTRRETVGLRDPRHPLHGLVGFSDSGQSAFRLDNKQSVELTAEVEIENTATVGGHFPQPLYSVVALPTAEAEPIQHQTLPHVPAPQPIFTPVEDALFIGDEAIAALAGELDATTARSKK
jgi:hypothetical protein